MQDTMLRMTMKSVLPALGLLLGACAAVVDPAPEQYRGMYTWGFEVNSFQPCGSSELWWVTAGDLHTRYRQVATRDYQPVFVVVSGEVGPPGRYGHLGVHSREIAVREVLEMRPARDGDCR